MARQSLGDPGLGMAGPPCTVPSPPAQSLASHGAVTAGAVAGFVEAVAVHPLDMIKTRCLSLLARLRATGALRRAADGLDRLRECRCATRVPAEGFRVEV
jgi:hypothetical protein